MSKFKISNKEILKDQRKSVLELHYEKLNEIENFNNSLKTFENELKILKNNNTDLEKIKEYSDQIENIKSGKLLTEYLLDFMPIALKINSEKEDGVLPKKRGTMDNFVMSTISNKKIEIYNAYISKFKPELKEVNLHEIQ